MLVSRLEKSGSTDVAVFITQTGRLAKRKILSNAGRYFVCDFGLFFLDKRKCYLYNNASVFFYDTRFPYPLDINVMFDIQNVLQSNGLTQLSKEKYEIFQSQFSEETRIYLDSLTLDYAAVHDFWNNAQETDSKTKESKASLPSLFDGGSWAIIKQEGSKIDIVKLRIDKKTKKAKSKYGEFELSPKRYSLGKAAVYFVVQQDSSLQTVNMSAYSMLPEFISMEPLLVRKYEKEIRFTDKASEMLGKKVGRNKMNILIILAVVTVGLFAFNYVVNPQLSKVQTDLQIEEGRQAELKKLQQEKQNLELKIHQLELEAQNNNIPRSPISP